MKLSIFKIILVVILLITYSMVTFVYAANNNLEGWEDPTSSGVVSDACTVSYLADKTSIKPGEDITFEVKVSNIIASSGIKMVELYVGDYDTTKFECKIRNYNEDTWSLVNKDGYITISSNDSEVWKTDEVLLKLIYTPKDGISSNIYNVNISNIRITTGDDAVHIKDAVNSLPIRVEIEKNYSCKFNFIPDKTSVKPGEEIAFDAKVSNINAGNGLKMVEFYLGNYDSTKFECKISNYNEDKWSMVNKDGYITITSNNSEPWKTDEILAKIIYTPKTGLADNTYQTKITNIKATTDDETSITMADTNLNIKVETPQNPSGGTTGGDTQGGTQGGTSQGEGTPSGSTTDGSTQNNGTAGESTSDGSTSGTDTAGESTSTTGTSSESKSSSTKSTEKESDNKTVLPYSGDSETLMIILGIVLFTATSALFYIRYKKFDI